MEREKILRLLNEALSREHVSRSCYRAQAAAIAEFSCGAAAKRLMEMVQDEEIHAAKLRRRITMLGGVAIPEMSQEGDFPAATLREMVDRNLREKEKAIGLYLSLLRSVQEESGELYDAVEEILQDEQEHREELERFREGRDGS